MARTLCTPLPAVLAMKITDFHRWHVAAQDVHEVTVLRFE